MQKFVRAVPVLMILAGFGLAGENKDGRPVTGDVAVSDGTYLRLLREAQRRGFRVCIHFLWLPKPANAIACVRERVKKGGHNVPVADIRRRFARGLRHFVRDYAPLAERWALWDNLMNRRNSARIPALAHP